MASIHSVYAERDPRIHIWNTRMFLLKVIVFLQTGYVGVAKHKVEGAKFAFN